MNILGFVGLAIIVLIILAIRYVIYSAVDKASDAIGNAITKKKNETKQPQSENLADLYKDK